MGKSVAHGFEVNLTSASFDGPYDEHRFAEEQLSVIGLKGLER